jgi:hypothetical protein
MNENPVTASAAVVAVIGSIITALVAFGLDVTDGQRNAIIGLVVPTFVLVGLIGAWWARRQVTPLANPRDNALAPLVRADGQTIKR